MFSLSHTTGYAIQALSCLDKHGKRLVLVKEIAKRTGVPQPYLAKVLNSLVSAGLVVSKRGCHGGVALARPAEEISLLDVAYAIEGEEVLPECVLGLRVCSFPDLCPTHDFWIVEREKIRAELDSITMAEVVEGRKTETGGGENEESSLEEIFSFEI
jgi:Rrf2 family protein